MKRDTLLNTIGFGLVGICFVASLYRSLTMGHEDSRDGRVVIRVAHYQLESGIRQTIDALAQDYMALHPNVRVEQIAIPQTIFSNWLITQLVGGTAPDLIEMSWDLSGDRVERYFEPITAAVEEANPYNQGTPLDGVPWRSTFLDGLSNFPCYNLMWADYYAVGLDLSTSRLYYNKTLFTAIFGADAAPPHNYEEFLDVCQRAEAWGRVHNSAVVPIASSNANGPPMMSDLFQSQTQQLMLKMDLRKMLGVANDPILLAYLQGQWSLRTPGVWSGLQLMSEVGRHMTPGFLQLSRDDASFYFLQGHSLFIMASSYDINSIAAQASFPVGIFALPLPSRDDPRYSQFVLGPLSEASSPSATAFGLTRNSKHQAEALDFLRFATSYHSNAKFTQLSHWLPSIVGVPVPEEILPFKPRVDGYIRGFSLDWMGADTSRTLSIHYNLLFGEGDAVETFTTACEQPLHDAILADLQRSWKDQRQHVSRSDTSLAGLWVLKEQRETPELRRKISALTFEQNASELLSGATYHGLKKLNLPVTP